MQFNSCPNLLSNYANEFVVGGCPSRLSRDLDSLGKGQKVSLTHVWQCERSGREGRGEDKRGKGTTLEWECSRGVKFTLVIKEPLTGILNTKKTDVACRVSHKMRSFQIRDLLVSYKQGGVTR